MNKEIAELAIAVEKFLKGAGLRLATTESCTGGWLAKVITDIAGSSVWFERGFVTYSNEAKVELLGVNPIILEKYGAVSELVVREMAEGALKHSRADIAVSISGVAGPGGGTPEKPVGTVWFAWAWKSVSTRTSCRQFKGDRESVRRQAVVASLQGILDLE